MEPTSELDRRRESRKAIAAESLLLSQSKQRMLEMSTTRGRQKGLLRLQNTGAKARAKFLLSKRAPPYPLYRRHRRPPPLKTPPTARATTPETTSSSKTEGFASLTRAAQQEKEQKGLRKCRGKGQR